MDDLSAGIAGQFTKNDCANVSPSFLDTLPKDLFDNAIRFFSHLPSARNWEAHIELSDLTKLLSLRGELGSFTKSRFKTLRISGSKDSYEKYKKYKKYGWKLRTEPYLWTNSIDAAREFILAGGGEYLKTLVLDCGLWGTEEMVRDFLKNCPNVTSLSTSYDGNSLVKKFGSQLETLEVMNDTGYNYRIYSTTLRDLTMDRPSQDTGKRNLWKRIGRGLERLVISKRICAKNEVDNIKQHCRNLKSISIKGRDGPDRVAIANLLASYGDQLEHAYLYNMNENQIRDVTDGCTNARFHLDNFGGDFLIFGLNAIGHRLESIKIKEYAGNGDYVELTNAWNKCVNLRELSIVSGNPEDLLETIFSTPKDQLSVLELQLPYLRDARKVMEVCAKGTRCIERFTYLGPKLLRGRTDSFLEANKSSLSYILIKRAGVYYESNKELEQLLDSILKLPALEELVLDCMLPNETSKALEKRGIYWKNKNFRETIYGLF